MVTWQGSFFGSVATATGWLNKKELSPMYM